MTHRLPAAGRRVAVLLVGSAFVACVALPGCSGTDGQAAMLDVPCSTFIDAVDDIGPSYAAHGSSGGFVALPLGALQLGRSGSTGSEFEGFRFSKFGLLVRRDRVASLEVAQAPGEAVLDYVHPDVGARALSVGPCRSGGAEWVVFAGGLWVTEPGCVELLAASGDEVISVRFPVGAPCDGGL